MVHRTALTGGATSAGNHPFVVGLRENETQLDKVCLTMGSDSPSGTGGAAAN